MNQLPASLWKRWQESWTTVAEETVRVLGEEQAGRFIDLANAWIEIQGAVFDAYAREEWLSSLVFLTFQGLLKEVWWFNFQFLGGSYPRAEPVRGRDRCSIQEVQPSGTRKGLRSSGAGAAG
jgi:hypothetical protein